MRATSWTEFSYFFMDLHGPMALMWYPLVGVMQFIVYCVFVALSVLTRHCRHRLETREEEDKSGRATERKEGNEPVLSAV
jgi:hypothetical protein